jgi:cellulose synthase/poly-beta-1,6-N-acetylglucosamine synthase-like glycosyltransferase
MSGNAPVSGDDGPNARTVTAFWTHFAFVLFAIATLASASYGLHMAVLLVLYARRQKRTRARQREIIDAFVARDDRANWPHVTTQLPIYNEADVVARLIDAVVAMDYPRARHEIQVLDDSTDDTRDLVDRIVRRYAAEGVDIKAVRRPDRRGYKAGALAHGVRLAKGELLPVFDADFVPPPDFLKRAVALLVENPKAACVQGVGDISIATSPCSLGPRPWASTGISPSNRAPGRGTGC